MTGATSLPSFHLAFAVDDLAAAREFYVEVLGCREGRSAERWVDFDFFGHQISAHLCAPETGIAGVNPVEDKAIPVPHFGLVLAMADWRALVKRIENKKTPFLIAPFVRFRDKPGEQASFFVRDPSCNALEFKAFADPAEVFRR